MVRCGVSQRTAVQYPLPLGKKAQRLAVPWLAEPLLSGLAPQTGRSFSPDALTQTERHDVFHQWSAQNFQITAKFTANCLDNTFSTAHNTSMGCNTSPRREEDLYCTPTAIMICELQWARRGEKSKWKKYHIAECQTNRRMAVIAKCLRWHDVLVLSLNSDSTLTSKCMVLITEWFWQILMLMNR